jgi:hypothetical protein
MSKRGIRETGLEKKKRIRRIFEQDETQLVLKPWVKGNEKYKSNFKTIALKGADEDKFIIDTSVLFCDHIACQTRDFQEKVSFFIIGLNDSGFEI